MRACAASQHGKRSFAYVHVHLKYAYTVTPELVHKRGVGEVASSHGVGTSAVSTGRFAEERAH
jgi:hypothetical protein